MKSSTLNSLITAKALYLESKRLIGEGSKYSASAGLIILQDSVELIVLALLAELGIDEKKTLDRKSFDELIGELKKAIDVVPKISTIKAMNKQRVIVKHFGQLAEPSTALSYAQAAEMLFEDVLKRVVGKTINEIYLTDFLPDCEAKKFLDRAVALIDTENYLEALFEIRKAFYVEYEFTYSIESWGDVDENESQSVGLSFFMKGGRNAPSWKRNVQWIESNVKCPTDYIQLDHSVMRLHALEWGISPTQLENLIELTPKVFRENKHSNWKIEYGFGFPEREANKANCKYCLDISINIIRSKKDHERAVRRTKSEIYSAMPALYLGKQVFAETRQNSRVVHVIAEPYIYTLHKLVTGFDEQEYIAISGYLPSPDYTNFPERFFTGFLLKVE